MSPNEIQELQPIAEALNAESNEINSIIAALNAKMAALNVGVEVWIEPREEDQIQIGYTKIGSGKDSSWQLATRFCEQIRRNENGDWEPQPGRTCTPESLLSASREMRIEALSLMPRILGKLKSEAQRSLDAIRAAKKMAAEL